MSSDNDITLMIFQGLGIFLIACTVGIIANSLFHNITIAWIGFGVGLVFAIVIRKLAMVLGFLALLIYFLGMMFHWW
ncbi:MAG: hypothetical protein WCK02_00215 [Bacteroidota bacterium]